MDGKQAGVLSACVLCFALHSSMLTWDSSTKMICKRDSREKDELLHVLRGDAIEETAFEELYAAAAFARFGGSKMSICFVGMYVNLVLCARSLHPRVAFLASPPVVIYHIQTARWQGILVPGARYRRPITGPTWTSK